jgi:hypothetical protein
LLNCSPKLSRRPRRRRLAVALVVLLTLLTPHAMAIPPSVERLYEEGKASLKASEPAVALGRFKDALRQAEGDNRWTWRLLLAVALAYKVKEEPQHAIEYFRRFLARTESHRSSMRMKWQKRREIAERDLVTLETQVEGTHGFVSVESTPPGAQISVDGTRAGADGDAMTPFMLILKPGAHLVRVTKDGHQTAEQKVLVNAGDSKTMRMVLTAAAPAKLEPRPPPPAKLDPKPVTKSPTPRPSTDAAVADTLSAVASEPDEGGSPVLAYITMGTSAAAGLAAVALTVMASGEAKVMDDTNRQAEGVDLGSNPALAHELATTYATADEARSTYEITAGVLYGVAVAGVTTGVILLLLGEPDETEADAPMPAFDLTPTQGGLYGRATWRF